MFSFIFRKPKPPKSFAEEEPWVHSIEKKSHITADKVAYAERTARENINFHNENDKILTETAHRLILVFSAFATGLLGFGVKIFSSSTDPWHLAGFGTALYLLWGLRKLVCEVFSAKDFPAPAPEPRNVLDGKCFKFQCQPMILGHLAESQKRISEMRNLNQKKGAAINAAIRHGAAAPIVLLCLALVAVAVKILALKNNWPWPR